MFSKLFIQNKSDSLAIPVKQTVRGQMHHLIANVQVTTHNIFRILIAGFMQNACIQFLLKKSDLLLLEKISVADLRTNHTIMIERFVLH